MRSGPGVTITFPWIVGSVLITAALLKSVDLVEGSPPTAKAGAWFARLQTVGILPELVLGFLLLGSSCSLRTLTWATCFVMCLTAAAGGLLLLEGPASSCKCFGRRVFLPVYWHLVLNGTLIVLLAVAMQPKLQSGAAHGR